MNDVRADRKRTYWALVESIRTKRGSRQRVVAYLGELAASEQSGWAQLGRSLSGKQRPSALAVRSAPLRRAGERRAGVGRICAAFAWNGCATSATCGWPWGCGGCLGLDTLLQSLAEPGREDVPWPVVAAILTIARFCKPSSELHIETTWYRGTALEDLLGVPVEKVHTDRLYDGLGLAVAAQSRGSRSI